jgi:uncharacterized membrane protein YqiK
MCLVCLVGVFSHNYFIFPKNQIVERTEKKARKKEKDSNIFQEKKRAREKEWRGLKHTIHFG